MQLPLNCWKEMVFPYEFHMVLVPYGIHRSIFGKIDNDLMPLDEKQLHMNGFWMLDHENNIDFTILFTLLPSDETFSRYPK